MVRVVLRVHGRRTEHRQMAGEVGRSPRVPGIESGRTSQLCTSTNQPRVPSADQADEIGSLVERTASMVSGYTFAFPLPQANLLLMMGMMDEELRHIAGERSVPSLASEVEIVVCNLKF